MTDNPLIADAERRLIEQAGMPFPIVERPPVDVFGLAATSESFPKDVPISLLCATQRDLSAPKVQEMLTADELEPIDAVLYLGWYYIADGHHRAVAARYRGDSTVPARVVDAGP